jgi:hypothetical protein
MTEVTQIMGHADQGRVYALYYKSDLSMVDVQGILMQGEEENIDWDQYLQPEETQQCIIALPLSKLREIEAQVAAVQGVQERCRLRKKLRNEAMGQFESSDTSETYQPCTSPQLMDSVERMGDLKLAKTINQIACTRFLPDPSIILEAWDIPDFDIRTNGLPALKALIRILRERRNGQDVVFYYPDEYPIPCGDSLMCGECNMLLDK